MTTSFADRLSKAEQARKQYRDVDVYLDDDIGERLAALEEELAALEGDKRLGDPRQQQIRDRITEVEAEAVESLVMLRFHRLPAEDWADIVARAPRRLDAPADRMYGYNIQAAAAQAAPNCGAVLTTVNGSDPTEEPISPDEWERLLKVISGRDFSRIVDAIFDLNDWGPEQRLDAARKASRAGTDTSSN